MERRRAGLIGPIILIAVGVLLLLNTLNLLPWSIWETLWRFWPVLLILLGLEILIGRRSWIGSLIILAVAVVAVIAVVAIGLSAGTLTGPVGERQTLSQPLADASRADVTINFGVGTATLHGLPSDSRNLMEGTVDNAPGRRVETDFHVTGDTAVLNINERAQTGFFFPFFGPQVESRWDIGLSSQVPLSLRLSTGVGQATLDLQGLKLTDLQLNTGVGQTLVTLPERGRFNVDLRGGVGNTVVTVPPGLAVRIRASQGLGNVSVNLPDVSRQGEEWVSRAFDTAEDRADIRLSGGVGNIAVR